MHGGYFHSYLPAMAFVKVMFSPILYLAILFALLILPTSGAATPPENPKSIDTELTVTNSLKLRNSTLAEVLQNIGTDAGDKPPATGQVTPFNILWALVALNLTYITHPLNASLWTRPCYQYHGYVSFYLPLLDAPLLLVEILHHTRGARLKRATQITADARAKTNSTEAPTGLSLKGLLSSSRRLISVITILQYVKLCGYWNIGNYFIWAALLLVSWLILEIVYYTANYTQMLDFPQKSPKKTNSRRIPIDGTAQYLSAVFGLMGVVGYFLFVLVIILEIGFESPMGSVLSQLTLVGIAVIIFIWALIILYSRE